MRITGLKTEVYQLRFPRPVYPAWTPGASWSSSEVSVFRVETDQGLVGIGAGVGSPAYVREVVAPRLVGQDPFATERITNILRDHGGPWLGHTSPWGVELALWDLIGKAASLTGNVADLRYVVCARSEVMRTDGDTVVVTARDMYPDPA